MQPSHDRKIKPQTGVARARMMFKQHLEWLPGYIFEPVLDLLPTSISSRSPLNESQQTCTQKASSTQWLFIGNDYRVKEKRFTREDLRVAESTVKKLVLRFPRALPKIVDDVDRWQARMTSLLGILKAWVHDDQPPNLQVLLNAGHFSERWLKQFWTSQKAAPALKTLLNAIACLQLTRPAEPDIDSFRWVTENAFALTLISQSDHLSPRERLELQFKFWHMRKEMTAGLLDTICRFISTEPAFVCPTENQFTAINFYSQSIADLRKRTEEQSTSELGLKIVPAGQEEIGVEILAVLDSTLHDKPKRRANVLQMLETLLTPEMMSSRDRA